MGQIVHAHSLYRAKHICVCVCWIVCLEFQLYRHLGPLGCISGHDVMMPVATYGGADFRTTQVLCPKPATNFDDVVTIM